MTKTPLRTHRLPVLEKPVVQLGFSHRNKPRPHWVSAAGRCDQNSLGPQRTGREHRLHGRPSELVILGSFIHSSTMHTWGVYSRVTYCLLVTLSWLHNRHCLWTIALLGCNLHATQFIYCDEPYGSFIIVFKVYHSLGPIFACSSSCITITQFRTSLSALKETTLATLSTSFPVLFLSY